MGRGIFIELDKSQDDWWIWLGTNVRINRENLDLYSIKSMYFNEARCE